MTREQNRSLYERIGGSEAIAAAIDAFYERVLADPRVSHYFDAVNVDRVKRQQQRFFELGTGGSATYDVDRIEAVHDSYDIDQEAYDVFVGHFEDTLRAFDLPEQEREELMDAVHNFHDEVVTAG